MSLIKRKLKTLPAVQQQVGYDPHQEACEAWDYIVSDIAKLQMGPVRRVLETKRDRSRGLAATDILERAHLIEYNARAFRQALESMIREGR